MADILNPGKAAELQCVRKWNRTIYGDRCERDYKDIIWFFYGPVLVTLLFLSLVGNTLVIIVTTRNKITSTGILLISLAIWDILTVLSFFTYYLPRRLDDYHLNSFLQDWSNFVTAEERTFSTLYRYCKSCATWMIVLITGERFIAVWKPLNAPMILTKRRIFLAILLVAVVMAVDWFPKWSVYYVEKWYCSSCRGFAADVTKDRDLFFYKIHAFGIGVDFMLDFAFPMSALLVMNSMITMQLKRAKNKRKHIAQGQKQSDDDETDMIVAVVVIFLILETPTFLLYVKSWSSTEVKLSRVVNLSTNATNFIIYALFGRRFRATLKSLFRCGNEKKHFKRVDTTTSTMGMSVKGK